MLAVKNLTVSYGAAEYAIKDVTFAIDKPSIVGIIGPNGAGKSTLFKAMLNMIPHQGKSSLIQHLANVAYVEQKSQIDYTFPIKVAECVELGIYPRLKRFGRVKKADKRKVAQVLAAVEMTDYKERQIGELSGGQFQRVLLARALAQDADIFLLDEPFVGIDMASEKIIMAILRQLKQEGKLILIVHHDLSKVNHYFDHLLILNKKRIAFGPTMEIFTPENLHDAYGSSVLTKGEF